ncbi:MAG: response regulator [Bacteroidales bacterium]|nr:response regulator [Bacteroidales bacterium]
MNKKILVVDDSSSNILLIQNFLEDEGFEVVTALDGKAALEQVKNTKPDVILLDLMMPEIDGMQVMEKLKQDNKTKNIPIIFISASKDRDIQQKAIDEGAHAFISKPLDFDLILRELDTLN